MANREGRESSDSDKKVRIKLKTDPIKQDPRSILAHGKTALKKDEGNFSSEQNSPDQGKTSEGEKEEQLYSRRPDESEDERKLKDDVVIASNSKEIAHKEKPGVKDENKPSESESKSSLIEMKMKLGLTEAKNDSITETPYKQVQLGTLQEQEQGDADLLREVSANVLEHEGDANVNETTPAPKQNVILDKGESQKPGAVEQDIRFSTEGSLQQNELAKMSRQAESSISNPYYGSSAKEGNLSKLPPTIEEEEDLFNTNQMPTSADGKKSGEDIGKLGTADTNSNNDIKRSPSTSITMQIRQSIEDMLLLKDEQGRSISNDKNIKLDEMKRTSMTTDDNEGSDYVKKAINSGDDPHDDSSNIATSEGKSPDQNEVIVGRVSVNNDYNTAYATKDTPRKKVGIKVKNKTNETPEQGVEEENVGNGQNDKNTEEKIRMADINSDALSPVIVDSDDPMESSSVTNKSPTTKAADDGNPEMTEETSNTAQHSIIAKEPLQRFPIGGKDPTDTQDNIDGKNDPEMADISGKDDPDDRKDGNDVPLERTTGSEDLKINELKKRVRPGQVFVVKEEANADTYTVRWAEKRKVLAYKVGSKNTSRFSTLLIETTEQLKKASVRHPSIVSELIHPTAIAKGSLLPTYLAGLNAKHSIEDTGEVGTNTVPRNEDLKAKSPEYNFFAKDHFSPETEVLGGAVPKQQTTGSPDTQSNHYSYPFLTDYDVNHERKDNK